MIYDLCIMINMLKFKQRHLAACCLIFPLKHNPIFIICNPHRLWQDCRIARFWNRMLTRNPHIDFTLSYENY